MAKKKTKILRPKPYLEPITLTNDFMDDLNTMKHLQVRIEKRIDKSLISRSDLWAIWNLSKSLAAIAVEAAKRAEAEDLDEEI